MKKLSFKGIITLTISAVYILSVVILFFVFNSFYIKSVRGKFLEELKYSAVVAKQMLDEEKENLRRDAGMVARDSALEFSLNRGINMYSSIIEKDLKNISLKEMNKLSYIKMTNILNSKLNISKEIKSGDKVLEVFDKNFILLGKSGEFQKNEVDTGKENYLTIFKESNDNNVMNLEPFGLITKKGDSFFVKGVDYIKYYTGINTMSLCEMKESPGYVVVSKRINQSMIDRIKTGIPHVLFRKYHFISLSPKTECFK